MLLQTNTVQPQFSTGSVTLKYLISIIVSIAFLIGCAEPDGPVGSKVGGMEEGEPQTVALRPDSCKSMAFPPIKTGSSQYLYVGETYDVSSWSLVRFEQPVMPEEWRVDSARIELHYKGGIGSGAFPDLSIEQFDFEWDETTTLTRDTIPDGDPRQFAVEVAAADSGKLVILPDTAWISDWLAWIDSSAIDTNWVDTSRTDGGLSLLLKADDAVDRLLMIRSRSAIEDDASGNLKPRLFIYLTIRDEGDTLRQDTVESFASHDLFLLDYDTAAVNADLVIGSGALQRSFLHFDIGVIDTINYYAVINRVLLTLHRASIADPWPATGSIWPFKLSDEMLNDDLRNATWLNITNTPTATDSSDSSIAITVTPAVASWIWGGEKNGWIALRSGAEGSDIDRVAFHSSESDTSVCPELMIHYTRFPR